MVVYIVGADHRIQWIPKSCGPHWADEIDKFVAYICHQCIEHSLELVAEEFSEHLVRYNSAKDSCARHAAMQIGLGHLFCDPDPDERAWLEIETNDDREKEWLRRLKSSEKERIFFICGDDHVDRFATRLINQKRQVEILSRNWGQGWPLIDYSE